MGRKKVIAFLLSICMVMGNASTLMAGQLAAVPEADTEVAENTEVIETTEQPQTETAIENAETAGETESSECTETKEGSIVPATEQPDTETVEETETEDTEQIEATEETEDTETMEEAEPLDTEVIVEEELQMAASSSENTVEISVTDASGAAVYTQTVSTGSASKGLQRLFDYCRDYATAQNPMKIMVPAGTYQISSTLCVYSNTTLELAKGATLKRAKKTVLLRFGRSGEETYGYDGYQNISIIGPDGSYGVFDGNGTGTSMVRFAHARNITFKNIRFTNVDKTHHMEFAGCENVTIDSCKFDGFVSSDYIGRSNYEALQLDILWPGHFGNYGAYDETINRNITISNNIFEKVSRGIGTHSAETGKYMTGIVIKNNQFKNIMGYAIASVNFAETQILDNQIENCGSGILFRHMIWDPGINYYPGDVNAIRTDLQSVISGNQITISYMGTQLDTYGIYAYGEVVSSEKSWESGEEAGIVPKGDYQVKGLTISGNKLNLYHSVPGIRLSGTTQSIVEKNEIHVLQNDTRGLSAGIFMEKSSGNTISENYIVNEAGASSFLLNAVEICAASNQNEIKKNTIKGTRNYGIDIQNSTGNVITGNKVEDTAVAGITVQNGSYPNNSTQIVGNTLNNTGKNGIYGLDDTNMTVTGNTIKKCSQFGIYFGQRAKGTAKDNVFKSCKSKVCIFKDQHRVVSPAQGKIAKISSKNKKVTLSWKKIKNVKKYTIYRSTKKTGKYQKIASVSKTKYVDKKVKKGKKYYYKIMPETKIGNVTVYGKESSVKSVKVKK